MGATIMGRNMFGPVRGSWGNSDWQGWWGDTPPYHCPVFVLTHHKHDPIDLQGGTTFHFVTDGIEAAYAQAAGRGGWPLDLDRGGSLVCPAGDRGRSCRRDRPSGEPGDPRLG